MSAITQDLLYKQSVCKYSKKYGVTQAAKFYKKTRRWIYYWLERYDGTPESLREKSRRPHSHPKQHTEEEIQLIYATRRQNPRDGLVDFWIKLRREGYARSVSSLFRLMRRLGVYRQTASQTPKYVPKLYEQMKYPGQRIQIDVKFVPKNCCINEYGESYYQFTAIDEYSRERYLCGFKDNSTYSAEKFLRKVVKYFKYKIECVQTDNGQEFTNRFKSNKNTKTLFQKAAEELGIRHKMIKPYTPRHNGKVERSHRKDNERFYSRCKFTSFEDFSKQLTEYNGEYNSFPMRPLGWKSPKEIVEDFFIHGIVYDTRSQKGCCN